MSRSKSKFCGHFVAKHLEFTRFWYNFFHLAFVQFYWTFITFHPNKAEILVNVFTPFSGGVFDESKLRNLSREIFISAVFHGQRSIVQPIIISKDFYSQSVSCCACHLVHMFWKSPPVLHFLFCKASISWECSEATDNDITADCWGLLASVL